METINGEFINSGRLNDAPENARVNALQEWLTTQCNLLNFKMSALPHDASFRRYLRITTHNQSYIVMDAPPEKENCFSFIVISNALRKLSLRTPEILQADLAQGFLLLTDFGDQTFLKVLNKDNAKVHYQTALQALLKLQTCEQIPQLDLLYFDEDFMRKEWQWHKEWFLSKLMGFALDEVSVLDEEYNFIAKSIAMQPQVFMHRDYHSGNLMLLPDESIGILDFQDAFIRGPITYDLASLLRDCYISWPEDWIEHWVKNFFDAPLIQAKLNDISFADFICWFDFMSIQRHLKALFTFSRKSLRDGQHHYLNHVPRTLNYLINTTKKYDETKQLHHFLNRCAAKTAEGKQCVQ